MENHISAPFPHLMEHLLPLHEDEDTQMKLMRTSQTSVRSPPMLQYEELKESHQWYRPEFDSEDPGRSQNLYFPTSIHQSDPQEEVNRVPQLREGRKTINIKPVTLYTHMNPFHAPRLNPSWPVLVPHFNPIASAPHQNPFCPIYSPPLHFNPNHAGAALVACGDSAASCLVLRPHMDVYPVYPTPYLHPNTQRSSSSVLGTQFSGRFPEDVRDTYGLWQRLCETAKGFSSGSPDTEALACFFMRVIRSFAVHSPDLPFTDAVNAAVREWRKISNFEREQYYINARMFIELEDQVKISNRADKDQSIPAQRGNVKITRKRSHKVVEERPVQDLAESALTEYSQVMDDLGSKVSGGSEVTSANKEDVCAKYLNQLSSNNEFTTEAGCDVDYIISLLTADHNLTDVLKENSQDMLSDINPEVVAGCSDWTDTTVPEAQVLPSSASQWDSSRNLQDHMMQDEFRMSTSTELLWLQDNVMDNGCQNSFQTLPEVQSSDQSISVQETINSALQDFVPDADGNSPGQRDDRWNVAELYSTVQSDCFSLQNSKSHHATFTHSIKLPKTPADGRMEHDGEENMVVGLKNVNGTKEKGNMGADISNDSQRTRNNATKTDIKIKEMSEENVNQNKRRKRRRIRPKQRKISALQEKTTTESDDKDGRRPKTAENQDGHRRSGTSKKHEAQETDLIKVTVEREQRTDVTVTRGNPRPHDGQETEEFERRQTQIKTGRSRDANKESRRMTEAEEDNGKTYGRAESGRPRKQHKLVFVGNDDFQSRKSSRYTRRDQNSYRRQTKTFGRVRKESGRMQGKST